jgi:hypothetical protein
LVWGCLYSGQYLFLRSPAAAAVIVNPWIAVVAFIVGGAALLAGETPSLSLLCALPLRFSAFAFGLFAIFLDKTVHALNVVARKRAGSRGLPYGRCGGG